MTKPNRGGGALTLAGSVAVLAGIPALLAVTAGWPLPHGVPSWAEVDRALSEGWQPEDTTLVRAVAALAWVAWAQLMFSAGVELVAQLRNRPSPAVSVPLSRWCRPFAVRFATTVVTLVGTLGPRPLPAGALQAPAMAVVAAPATSGAVVFQLPERAWTAGEHHAMTDVEVAPRPGRDVGMAAGHAGRAPIPERGLAAGGPVHVVCPGDTLWRVAETHLGDPFRWGELWELNRDRLQPDGDRLADPDLLRPGWHLLLPDPATSLPPAEVAPPGPPAGTPPPPAPPLVSVDEAPVGGDAGVAPSVVVPSAAATSGTSGEEAARSADERKGAPFTAGVPHLIAGAVIGYLTALLRQRERWRRPGHRFPKPAPALTDVERQVRAGADPDGATLVDLALRHLASALAETPGRPAPGVLAVRYGPMGLEILLDAAAPDPPALFEAVDGGWTWRLDASVGTADLAEVAGDQPPPLPALASVGATPDGAVLIDLAAVGSLAITGDDPHVAATLRSIALELATAPWAAGVDLVLLGGDTRLQALERARMVDPGAAVDDLGACARFGDQRPVGLTAAVEGSTATPTVALIAPGALPPGDLDALLRLAVPGNGLVVVVAGQAEARSVLHLGPDGRARLEPLGIDLDALPEPEVTDALVELLTDVATPASDVPEADLETASSACDRPVNLHLCSCPAHDLTDFRVLEGCVGVEPLVWVRVLGPVEVTWRRTATRPQLTELLTFIATHPPRIGADRVKLALWPVDPDDERFGERSPNTLWALVSKARLALGTDPDGGDLLATLPGNVYELSPLVASDWIRFEKLRKAAADEPELAVPLLREALELVRGRPFQDIPPGAYSWVGLDRLDSDMEAAVAEAASGLVAAALALDDIDTARFAVERGRLGAPHSEALIRCSMRVAAAAGDGDRVDRALRDARRLAELLDPTGEPEPETLRLYEELRRR